MLKTLGVLAVRRLSKSIEQANQNHEVQIYVSFGKWSHYWKMANETVAETIVEEWDSSMFGGWKCEMARNQETKAFHWFSKMFLKIWNEILVSVKVIA